MSERTALEIAVDLDAVVCSSFVKLEAAKALRSQAAEIYRLIAERDAAIADAVAAEREACAQVCDELEAMLPGTKIGNTLQWAAERIRARGKS